MTQSTLPVIPPSWSWAELGDVLSGIEAGNSFKCEERPPGNTEVGVVKVSAVTWGTFDEDASKTCLSSKRVDPKLFIQPGDFLFSRANTIQLVGASVIVHAVSRRLMLSDKILRFRIHTVIPYWLLYVLRTPWGRAEIERLATGNQESMRNIGQDRIRAIRMPVPPLEEQLRIVAEIDKQLSTLDSATHNLDLVASKAALYRNSYLNTIFGGTSPYSLNPDARESRAGLAEVLQQRHSLRHGKLPVEPVPPETVEDLPLPPGWIVASIDQVCSQVTDGEHIQPPYQESGFPMLSATHVRGDSVTFAGAGLISAEAFAVARMRCAPGKGDILVVSVGATTGRAGKVNTSDPFALVRSVLLLKPLINADILLRWLQSLYAQKWIKRASGSTAQPHLYIRDIKRMPIPFAPLPVQDRVASAVEERLSGLARLEATAQAAASRAARLRQAILKKAFEGKLVPQDPNDEPASVLPERIRAARG